jgi:hypothetical protein
MGNQTLTKFILMYKYDKNLLKASEKGNLINRYASAINYQGEITEVLKEIK